MRAAVFHAPNDVLTVEDIDLAEPRSEEVVVRTGASGVCHSDLHFVEGLYSMATPAVLGHEGAGVVEAVGDDVTMFAPGDRVIACLSIFCGYCDRCLSGEPFLCLERPMRGRGDEPALSWKGGGLTQMAGLATYAEKMLVHQNALVKIEQDIGVDRMALIGCGVTTGLGAVLNTAGIEVGSTVAVFGAGGVGLSAIQGARIGGARTIIAVDVHESKLATARELGATHSVDASSRDPVEAIKGIVAGGVDYTFEAIGLKATAEQAYEAIRRGGTATVIGMIPQGVKVEIDGPSLLGGKRLQGSSMGSNRFRIDMPRYVDWYLQGRLLLDEMITRRGKLEDINEAFRAMKAGEVARSVLMFDEDA